MKMKNLLTLRSNNLIDQTKETNIKFNKENICATMCSQWLVYKGMFQ